MKTTSTLADSFVVNLVAACDRAKINQRELARRSGVHYTTINRIVKKHLDPSLSTCELLAKALEMRAEKIFRAPAKS